MHRDTQIGLAMSIVLIGFAAALCFPRDRSGPAAAMYSLPESGELDASIEQLPVRAYTPSRSEEKRTKESPVDSQPVEREDHASAAEEVAAVTDPTVPSVMSPADASEASVVQFDRNNPFLEAVSVTPPAEQDRVHIVESGDTLSGIAQKYLGSVARYPEVFDANRDQLDSPDDLELGMKLRIPVGAPPGQAQR